MAHLRAVRINAVCDSPFIPQSRKQLYPFTTPVPVKVISLTNQKLPYRILPKKTVYKARPSRPSKNQNNLPLDPNGSLYFIIDPYTLTWIPISPVVRNQLNNTKWPCEKLRQITTNYRFPRYPNTLTWPANTRKCSGDLPRTARLSRFPHNEGSLSRKSLKWPHGQTIRQKLPNKMPPSGYT